MFLSIELIDFMGFNRVVELKTVTSVSGRNGSGKTSVLNALAFALCGTDAWGTPAPTFMISNEKDKMEVIVKTDKTTIKRSLTKKKTHTIKMLLQGVWVDIGQKQMAEIIGPTQHILSVINPKFFFTLTQPKQLQLLSSLISDEDRLDMIQTISGEKINDSREIRDIRTKQPLRVAELYATKRRVCEQKKQYRDNWLKNLEDKRKELEEAMNVNYANAIDEQELERLKRRDEIYQRECDTYDYRKEEANEKIKMRDAKLEECSRKIKALSEDLGGVCDRIKSLDNEIEAARQKAMDARKRRLDATVKITNHTKDNYPRQPAFMDLSKNDHCPRCGQAVSKRYRESIEKENKEAQDKFNKEMQAYENEKADFDKTLCHLADNHDKAVEVLKSKEISSVKLCRQKKEIEDAIATQKREYERQAHQSISAPTPPEKDYSVERIKELDESLKGLRPSREMEAISDKLNSIELDKIKILQDHEGIDEALSRYSKLEVACKTVIEKEVENAEKLFKLPCYTISQDVKDMILDEEGTPYTKMSSGQKLCAEMSLSFHINSLLEKKINIVFLDDVDLIDANRTKEVLKRVKKYDIQIIQSKVTVDDFSSEAL